MTSSSEDLRAEGAQIAKVRSGALGILRAWTHIHAKGDTALISVMMDAMVEALLVEWPQWVQTVTKIGETYITDSPEFVQEADQEPEGAVQRAAQGTWDSANATFDRIFVERLSSRIAEHVLYRLNEKRDELRIEMLETARRPPKSTKSKPVRHKLRRKRRRKSKKDG